MSLRAFHIVFITLATLLVFGCAALLYGNYEASQGFINLILCAVAVLTGFGMIAYGVWFFKKTRKIIL